MKERDFCIFFILIFFFFFKFIRPFCFLAKSSQGFAFRPQLSAGCGLTRGGWFSFEKLLSFFSKTAFEMCVMLSYSLSLSLFFSFFFFLNFLLLLFLMCGRLHGTHFKLKACLYYCIRWPFFPFFDTSLSLSPSLRTNGIVLRGNCLLSPTSFLDLNQTVLFFVTLFYVCSVF